MRHPSSILFPLAFALLAFAAGLQVGSRAVAHEVYDAAEEKDSRFVSALVSIRSADLGSLARVIAGFGVIAVSAAGFARMKCELGDRVLWKRLIVFVAITTAIVIGSQVAYIHWQVRLMGDNA